MARGAKGQAEKNDFVKDLKKFIKAAMILEIYLFNKSKAENEHCTKLKEFVYTTQLLHTVGVRTHSCTGTFKKTEFSSWPKPGTSHEVNRSVNIGWSVVKKVVNTLLSTKPKGFVKKIPLDQLKFTQSTCTEEEFEWAKYVLIEAKYDLSPWHLEEYEYELSFQRTRTVIITDTLRTRKWFKNYDDAIAAQQDIFEKQENFNNPYSWYESTSKALGVPVYTKSNVTAK